MLFENKQLLLSLILLLIPIGFFIYTLYWKRRVKKNLGDSYLISYLTKSYSSFYFTSKFLLVFTCLFLLVIAIANPLNNIKDKTKVKVQEKKDLMVVLDLSNSMLAKDVLPSRLERAKLFINELLDSSDGNRIGLIVFAGKAYQEMPLTTDLSAIEIALKYLNPEDMPIEGTNTNEALLTALKSVNTHQLRSTAIVLISDGEDKDNQAIQVTEQLNKQEIPVYTIGVGTVKGANIQDSLNRNFEKDQNGKVVVTRLNISFLKDVANKTKGQFFNLSKDDYGAFVKLIINHNDNSDVENVNSSYYSLYIYVLVIAIVLLVVEIFIPEIKKSVI